MKKKKTRILQKKILVEEELIIEKGEMEKGIYFVEIQTGKEKINRKIINIMGLR